MRANAWLAVGIVVALLIVCAWIGWAIDVWSEHGARQGLGVLIVWPAILAVIAVISIPFIWAFSVIRRSTAGAYEPEAEGNEGEKAIETG